MNLRPCLEPPPSKSDAQRALILNDILGGDASLLLPNRPDLANDIVIVRDALQRLSAGKARIDCQDGGAPFRFLLTQASLRVSDTVTFVGTPRLGARPQQPLFDALTRTLGAAGFRLTPGSPWPLEVSTSATLPRQADFLIESSASSQFASSLLLGAARLVRNSGLPSSVILTGGQVSRGYLDMTLSWLERAGFDVTVGGSRIVVESVRPKPLPPIPGDWSSLTYLLALAWKSGALVKGVDELAEHPDKQFLALLRQIGLSCEYSESGLTVNGSQTSAIDVDASAFPDAMPTVAALACISPFETVIRHTEILTVKESDRLHGIERMVTSVGGRSVLRDGTLRLFAPARAQAMVFDAHDDHRMAMAAAVTASLCDVPLNLTGHDSVKKSFPAFWEEYRKVSPDQVRFDSRASLG